MSMSTYVVGFHRRDKQADERWYAMKEIGYLCGRIGVPIPKEVDDFFGHKEPGDKPGIEIDIKSAVREWNTGTEQGFEVDIAKLPPEVCVLHFINSW